MLSYKDFWMLLGESLDSPCVYSKNFIETYKDGRYILNPIQVIRFKTDRGLKYEWEASEHPYLKGVWLISFGNVGGDDVINMNLTGTGDAMKVMSTVVAITNDFIDFDKNKEIQKLTFSSSDRSRSILYKKRLNLIKGFKLEEIKSSNTREGDTYDFFILSRI